MDKQKLKSALSKISKFNLLDNYEESIQLIDNLLKEPLDDIVISELYYQKAICFSNLKKYIEAKKCLIKSLDAYDNSDATLKNKLIEYINELGWAFYETDEINDSIECFDMGVNLDPTSAKFYNCKAMALEALESFDEAFIFYNKALELEPENGTYILNKQDCFENKLCYLVRQEDYGSAIECCDEALKEYPEESNFYNCKAFSLESLGNFDEAKEFYNMALKFNLDFENYEDNKKNILEDKIEYLIRKDDYSGAIKFCDLAINEFPNECIFYRYKADSLDSLGKTDEALEFHIKVLEFDYEYQDYNNKKNFFVDKIEYSMMEFFENYEEALKYCDLAIYKFPNESYFYNCKATSLENLGKHDEAEEFYNKALELEPDDENRIDNKEEYIEDKIDYLMEKEDYDGAIKCCDLGIKEFPDESYFYNCKAISLESFEKYDEALKLYDKALELEPDDENIIENKEDCFQNKINHLMEKEEDYGEAVKCCNEAIKEFPTNSNFYNCKAISLENLEMYDEALEFYNKALEIEPNDEVIKGNKESCFESKIDYLMETEENYEKAIKCCDEALKEYPEESNLLNCKAISLENLEMYDEALEFYNKALELEPDDEVIKGNKESCLESKVDYLMDKEDYDGAIKCCDLGIKEYPDESYFYNCKAISLESSEKYDEALKLYDKALDLNPGDENIMENKEDCFENLTLYFIGNEDYEGAIDCCDEALKEYPNGANLYNIKAIALISLERFDEALEAFDKAIEIEPDEEIFIKNKKACIESKNQSISR